MRKKRDRTNEEQKQQHKKERKNDKSANIAK